MVGHSKIATTLVYADVDKEKLFSDMCGIEEKLKAKKGIVIEHLKNHFSLSVLAQLLLKCHDDDFSLLTQNLPEIRTI